MKEREQVAAELFAKPMRGGTSARKTISSGRAIILSGDETASASLPELVQQSGLQPICIGSMARLRSCQLNSGISLMLCEERLPDGTFRDALDVLHGMAERIPLVVFSRIAEWETYLEAVRWGAYDCLRYPFRSGELQRVIERMLESNDLSTGGADLGN